MGESGSMAISNTTFSQKVILLLFSVFLFLVVLECSLRIGGCVYLALQEQRNQRSLGQRPQYRILCLGESTTARQYPPYLEQILNDKFREAKFSVIDKGVPGINSTVVLNRLYYNIKRYKPHMIIVMMGINDVVDQNNILSYYSMYKTQNVKLIGRLKIYKLTKMLLTRIKDAINRGEYRTFINRTSDWYVEEGSYCKSLGDFKKAEQMFEKALQKNPKNYNALFERGICYLGNSRYKDVESLFRRCVEINPNSDIALFELARCVLRQNKPEEAEQIFQQIMKLNPSNIQVYVELGIYYEEQGKKVEAKEMFSRLKTELEEKKSFKDGDLKRFRQWCGYYMRMGRYLELKVFLEGVVMVNPNREFLVILEACCKKIGENQLAEVYSQMLFQLEGGCYNSLTQDNYRKLVQLLIGEGIMCVCMEYSLRSANSLKAIVGNKKGVIVVSNEEVFEEALKHAGYEEYFVDRFSGIFGHCTVKGNRLLAERLSEVIIKELPELRSKQN